MLYKIIDILNVSRETFCFFNNKMCFSFILLTRACLKNAFCQMCVIVCGKFMPNEGRIGSIDIKVNALYKLNLAQISRKVVNTSVLYCYTNVLTLKWQH